MRGSGKLIGRVRSGRSQGDKKHIDRQVGVMVEYTSDAKRESAPCKLNNVSKSAPDRSAKASLMGHTKILLRARKAIK